MKIKQLPRKQRNQVSKKSEQICNLANSFAHLSTWGAFNQVYRRIFASKSHTDRHGSSKGSKGLPPPPRSQSVVVYVKFPSGFELDGINI